MKRLIAQKEYTTHINHIPLNAITTEADVEDYKKAYEKRIWQTIKLKPDFQKFDWEVDVKFVHNIDEIIVASVLEETFSPYSGFKVSIKQYINEEEGLRRTKSLGRTKKKGMIRALIAKVRELGRKDSRLEVRKRQAEKRRRLQMAQKYYN